MQRKCYYQSHGGKCQNKIRADKLRCHVHTYSDDKKREIDTKTVRPEYVRLSSMLRTEDNAIYSLLELEDKYDAILLALENPVEEMTAHAVLDPFVTQMETRNSITMKDVENMTTYIKSCSKHKKTLMNYMLEVELCIRTAELVRDKIDTMFDVELTLIYFHEDILEKTRVHIDMYTQYILDVKRLYLKKGALVDRELQTKKTTLFVRGL